MRIRGLAVAVAGALALATPRAGPAHEAHPEPTAPDTAQAEAGPGFEPPRFVPPAAGSYALPPITRVTPHELLDHRGKPTLLPGLAPGRVGFVAFVYLSCPAACPLTLGVLQRLDRELASEPGLGEQVEIAVVSFDPARDTPEALAALRQRLEPRGSWHFLTAPDRGALATLLSDYGQDAVPLFDAASGEATGLLRHVMKVFLVDDEHRVRNIYSSEFLDWRLLRNDALTVLEEGA